MLTPELLLRLKRRVADAAIGASTLRNQGAIGVVAAAREFLASLDPATMVTPDELDFRVRLDEATSALRAALPSGAQHWGAARKALNIFLRDLLYNSYLVEAHGLAPLRHWLEVPLDSHVARGLRASGGSMPRWPGVKHLSLPISDLYQSVATDVAMARGVARVDLDVFFWRASVTPK